MRLTFKSFLSSVALIALAPLSAVAGAITPQVHVTTDITGGLASIQVNQTAIINVRAVVENPGGANDGIFTFDQDLVLANLLVNQPSVLAVQLVTRPNVSDNIFGGSDGAISPSGVAGIYGGYLSETLGIGSPTLLFSVVVKGIAVGADSITPGPSLIPLGFDFTLNQSGRNLGVTYDGGVTLAVSAAPDIDPGGGTGGGPGGTGGTGGGGTAVPLPPAAYTGLLTALLMAPGIRRLRRLNV